MVWPKLANLSGLTPRSPPLKLERGPAIISERLPGFNQLKLVDGRPWDTPGCGESMTISLYFPYPSAKSHESELQPRVEVV